MRRNLASCRWSALPPDPRPGALVAAPVAIKPTRRWVKLYLAETQPPRIDELAKDGRRYWAPRLFGFDAF